MKSATPMTPSSLLREYLRSNKVARVAGVHDAVTAVLAERLGFECLWSGSLGVSAVHGVPDASILTMTEFLAATRVLVNSTTLPVIADCDCGFGDINIVARMVRDYEQAGVAAVCIEDKPFPKRNSFFGRQELAPAPEFAAKLAAAKRAQRGRDFVLIARTEALVAEADMDEAIRRGQLYVEAGADLILVHSKAPGPEEVLEFARRWQAAGMSHFLFVVPTTYPRLTLSDLAGTPIRGVIYANQALRAYVSAVERVLRSIIAEGTSAPVERELASVKQVFDLTSMDGIARQEAWFDEQELAFRRSYNRLTADDPAAVLELMNDGVGR